MKVKVYKRGGTVSASKAKEILRDGTAQGHPLTTKQKRYFGWIAGGKAANGASIQQLSENDQSSPIMQFNGPSHEDGGIPIMYANQGVEVEGGETAYIDREGDLNVLGNMKIPGTDVKFKNMGKEIAKKENKAQKKFDKGINYINESDPYNKWDRLKFNTGMLMAKGAQIEQKKLTDSKEYISSLQQGILDRVEAMGINPYRGRNGDSIMQDGGKKKSLAQRHNNPGNIMYNPNSKYQQELGATKGEARYDNGKFIGYFANFPNIESGKRAMQTQLFKSPSYRNLTVDQAARRWVHGSQNSPEPGYGNIPSDLAGRKISSLSPDEQRKVLDTFTVGEDSKKYNWEGIEPVKPTTAPEPNIPASIAPPNYIPLPQTGTPDRGYNPPTTNIPVPGRGVPTISKGPGYNVDMPNITPTKTPPTKQGFRNPLKASQYLPEVLTILTEKPDFVPCQRYEPKLYQPYQVSFQDRLNENQATFNALARQTGGNQNSAALSFLAGQKYQADSAVLADEFRTNQGITNEVYNKNISLLNDAQLKNLQLADTQFVRQEQAKATTRENINNAVNSLSSKINQNRLETLSMNATGNLFPQYTFDGNGNLVYIPNPNVQFGAATGGRASNDNYYQRSREEYGPTGQLRKTVINTPSDAEKVKIDYNNWNNKMKHDLDIKNMLRNNPLGRGIRG